MSLNPFGRIRDNLDHAWSLQARPEQRMPPDDDPWTVWLYLAGRGAGKTRSGAEGVREWVETGRCKRVGLIAPTAADARDVMLEGASGILSVCPSSNRPTFEPSKRRLTWPSSTLPSSGAIATIYSAEEMDRLRGPQHDGLWCDELAAWPNAQGVWDMAMFGLRLGRRPRVIVTTTPRPIKIIRDLLARDGKDVRVTRGRTADNAANLAPTFLESIVGRYEGTRLGRQELDAEVLLEIENALWTHAMIDQARNPHLVPDLERVVVAVDPSGTGGAADSGDAIGIVIAGKGSDGRCYVLGDWTIKASPDVWGRRVVEAYRYFNADRVVAERNFGGAMVEHVLRTVDASISFKEVVASRGKVQRAEPVSALYEQSRVSHVRDLTALEAQMVAMTSQGYQGDGSPDRVDALVWALSDLMIAPQRPQFVWGGLERRSELDIARSAYSTDHYH